ncbi:MAG: hypothetical protein H6925_01200 [Holosporaceae bacterium]|nr:MAG: hypothetical protein H6925_01200 [Holosporaceae bacterium]
MVKKDKIEDVFDIKADVMSLLSTFNISPATTQISTEGVPSWYHPGRSAWVQRGPKNKLAVFGEIHPKILKAFGIKERVYAFEMNMQALMPLKVAPKKALDISDFPKVERDFSFLFPSEVSAQDIVKTFYKVDPSITFVDVFDVYQGEGVPDGKKSLSLRVCFESKEKTFTDQEIKAIYDAVVTAAERQLKGQLKL